MKNKTNEELKQIVNNSGWASLNYELENDTIENVIKKESFQETIFVNHQHEITLVKLLNKIIINSYRY